MLVLRWEKKTDCLGLKKSWNQPKRGYPFGAFRMTGALA